MEKRCGSPPVGAARQSTDASHSSGHLPRSVADGCPSSEDLLAPCSDSRAAANSHFTCHAPGTGREKSLASLWGQPVARQRGAAPTPWLQTHTGSPLGCAVLRASAAVRSGRDSPPFVGQHSFDPAFDTQGHFEESSRYGGFPAFGSPGRFGQPGGCTNVAAFQGPAGLEPLRLARDSWAFGDACGAERLSPLDPGIGTIREDGEAVEGWGARGWGGDSAGVKKTSGDAASSKLSASLLGYFPDEFLKHFVTRPTRMQPLINRGYYSRVEAIRRLIVSFLEDAQSLANRREHQSTQSMGVQEAASAEAEAPPMEKDSPLEQGPLAQVVNIGAGADTTAFFLARWGNAIVFDVDFPDVCWEKLGVIQRVSELRECLGETCASRELWVGAFLETTNSHKIGRRQGHQRCSLQKSGFIGELRIPVKLLNAWLVLVPAALDDPCVLRTTNYRLVAVDIRNAAALKAAMKAAGLRENLPTLFLCECVLIYLHVEEADAVVRWASEATPLAPSAFIIYEQFNPNDPFGRVMARNLQTRNCPLLTISKYPSLESQKERFAENGWPEWSLADMRHVYENFLPKSERDRVQLLEIFDELEEWWLIQSHYFLGVFVRPAPPQAGGSTLPSLINVLG